MQECINLARLFHLSRTIAPGEIYSRQFTANGGIQMLLSELAGTENEIRCGGSTVKVVSIRHITEPSPGLPSEIEVFLEGVKYLSLGSMEESEPPAMNELDTRLKEGINPDAEWRTFLKEHEPKDPVEHDFGEWLGLEPIVLEPGILVNRTIGVVKKTSDLLQHYYAIGQQFRIGLAIVSIYKLFALTCSCEDDGVKTYTITMTLEIQRLLPGI